MDPGSIATSRLIQDKDGINGYSLVGLISLPDGGTIVLDCSSPTTEGGYSDGFWNNKLVASKVDGIN